MNSAPSGVEFFKFIYMKEVLDGIRKELIGMDTVPIFVVDRLLNALEVTQQEYEVLQEIISNKNDIIELQSKLINELKSIV